MIAEYKRKTNWGVGLGLVALVSGNAMAAGAGGIGGRGLMVIGIGLFIWGCVSYAKAKGQHPAWGILGLFSIFGLIALVLMKDRHAEEQRITAASSSGAPPPPPQREDLRQPQI
jgi:hypothetical protein